MKTKAPWHFFPLLLSSLLLLVASSVYGQASGISYCSGSACDPSNGGYVDPYTSDFLPGGIYNVSGNSYAHMHWANFPSSLHWYQCSFGTTIGSMQHGCTGRNFGNQSNGSGAGYDNYDTFPNGNTVCNYVTDAVNGADVAWSDFFNNNGPLPDSSKAGFAVCWQKVTIPAPRAWLGGAVINNTLFTVGGGTCGACSGFGGTETAAVEAYDSIANTWSTKASLETTRFGLTSAAVNGQVFAIGGTYGSSSSPLGTVEVFDPNANAWSMKTPLSTPRWKLTSSSVNGLIYAIGGGASGNQCVPSSAVEAYEPSTDSWISRAAMPTARWGAASDVINGQIYVVGGSQECSHIYVIVSAILEVYDPATDTWIARLSMPTPRWDLGAAALGGKLYAIGGWDPISQKALHTVEEFDPNTNSWATKSPMPTARSGLVTLAINGRIYAFGGSSETTVLNTLEIYDPSTDTWSAPLSQIGAVGSYNPQATYAEPVSTGNGNYFYQHIDISAPGRSLALIFGRNYNALDSYAGPLGANWTHSYNIILTQDADGTVHIRWGDGHTELYVLSGSSYVSQPGVFSTLVKNVDSTYVLTQKNQTAFNFSAAGKLSTIVDLNGNALSMSYDSFGNLTQITDTVGRKVTLTYDSSNRITQITDPINRTISFQYSSANDLTTFTDQKKGVTTYAYDGSHRVTSITLPGKVSLLTNTYDGFGRVISQTNGRQFPTTFAYGIPAAGQTTITDPLGNATVHTYDNSLRIVSMTDALNGTVSYSYDGNNNRTSITNQNGKTTNFTYDSKGSVLSVIDPLGNTSSFTYDTLNNLLTFKNGRGNTTNFTYDTKGNLTTVQDALTNKTTLVYDLHGELTSKTDARNNRTKYTYNSSGNLTKITDALNHVTTMTYDGIGRFTSVKDANSHKTTTLYDALSRITKITDPLGNATTFSYSGVGTLTKITDANGKATTYSYDAVRNLTKVTDAAGNATKYTYDANNNRTSFTNANSKNTSYAYDKLNRLTNISDPLNFTTAYTYDAVGNVNSRKDAEGHTTQFANDAVNRLTGISYFDGTSVTYSYDADGDRTSMVDSRGTTSYVYDAVDRVISVTDPTGAVVSYAYDGVGHRSTITYPDTKAVTYAYDAANRLSSATDWLGQKTSYGYDAANQLTSTAYPSTASISLMYDAANRLTQVKNTYPSSAIGSSAPFSTYTYALDKVGNRQSVTDGNGAVTSFGYDPLYELTSVTNVAGITSYTYDKAENRLTLTNSGGTTPYTYDAADRMLTAGATTFTYDKNGNRTTQVASGQTLNYGYNAANRLVSVTGGTQASTFAYDGDGNRVSQSVGSGTYFYSNDIASALPIVLQENGPDGFISYAYGLQRISESSSAFRYFYHPDGLGSTVGLTDATGTLQQGYAYDAWGNNAGTLDYVGTANKFRFTREALDPGTQLYYLRARDYDPSIGRFLTRDSHAGTIFAPLTLARFAYVLNRPTGAVDPSGMAAEPTQETEMFADSPKAVANQLLSMLTIPPVSMTPDLGTPDSTPVFVAPPLPPKPRQYCTFIKLTTPTEDFLLDIGGLLGAIPGVAPATAPFGPIGPLSNGFLLGCSKNPPATT